MLNPIVRSRVQDAMESVGIKADSAESAFIERELESVRAGLYAVKYGPLQCRDLLPVSNEDDPGAETIKINIYDGVGLAKIISSYAKDFPRADVKVTEQRIPVRSIGASYGYNVQEMRAAALAKRPVDQMKAQRARLAVDEKLERVAFFGDTANGLVGLFAVTNAQVYAVPLGAGGSATFALKTPDEILKDLNGMWRKSIVTTNGLERPDTLALPANQFGIISTTPRSGTSDTTIKNFFLANNPDVKRIVMVPRLTGQGSGATDRAIMYRAQPDALQLCIPQEFEQFPPQMEGMDMVTPCHMRTGGLLVFFPLSVVYGDGI
jgi:hypothetical protein